MRSLRARLLLAASLTLLVFIVACAAGLERAFRDAAQQAEHERLQGLVYTLLGAADFDARGVLSMPAGPAPEPRLNDPESGLAAAIFDTQGRRIWSSKSLPGDAAVPPVPEVGAWTFTQDRDRFSLTFGVRWLAESDTGPRYTFWVAENSTAYRRQLSAFRATLGLWLAVAAVALLLAQAAVLGWLLRPLTRIVRELNAIEHDRQQKVEGEYPSELAPLTGALNAMIRSEREHRARYRDALGDLAHNLKTPLAVLRGLAGEAPAELARRLSEPLERMQPIIEHQLRKAATAGGRTLGAPLAPRAVALRVISALEKVHTGRGLEFRIAIDEALRLRADENDLYELFGNLLDNAGKWARHQVRIGAREAQDGFVFEVEDDGPGFPPDAERLLARGARADSRVPGHGLGLAAVDAIVTAYGGTLELGRSALGGARVRVALPKA